MVDVALDRPQRTARPSPLGGKAKGSGVDTWSKNYPMRTTPFALSEDILRQCYIKNAAVRWCVDTIARETAFLPWAIVPNYLGPLKPRTLRHIVECTQFFNNPNANEESFPELLQAVLNDMLVIDRGIVEKVFSVNGLLAEIWARNGATFHPKKDEHGVLLGYTQRLPGEGVPIEFSPNEIMFFRMNPSTYTVYGQPILEAIVNEIGAVMFSTDWIAKSFSEDEIPPGILMLGEIGVEAYARAKADFQENKGVAGKGRIRVIDNVKDAQWVELKRSNADQQLLQIMEKMDRVVYRNFDIEYDVSGSDVTTLSLLEKLHKIKLIQPLARKIAWKINNELIPSFGYEDIRFQFVIRDAVSETARSVASRTYVMTGQRSINEVRQQDGHSAIPGGDRRFMLIGKRLIFVDDLDKMQSEGLTDEGSGSREGEETSGAASQSQRDIDDGSVQLESLKE